MKARLFFLFLLCLVLASQARISIPRSGAASGAANTKVVLTKLPGSPPISSFNNPANATKGQAATYGQLPLSFEANQGQTDLQVQFLCRGNGYRLFLTKTEALLQFRTADFGLRNSPLLIDDFRLPINRAIVGLRGFEFSNPQSTIRNPQFRAVRMRLFGANPNPQIEGLDRIPGISNYFFGNDPKKWHSNIPNFARVRYRDVYPGIDLAYYGNQHQLEYDLVVAPGADPSQVTMSIDGSEMASLRIDSNGDLVVGMSSGEIRQQKPRIYQEANGHHQELSGRFLLKANGQVGIELDQYDVTRKVVIDPVLDFDTSFGGSFNDGAYAIAVDSAGSVYATGYTQSLDFPASSGVFQSSSGGSEDAFVTKLSPDGKALIYSTYLGASGIEAGTAIAVDASGQAYVSGVTDSANFPVTPGCLQLALGGQKDAFVAKLNPSGSGLAYSTYLGGSSEDSAGAMVLDPSGNITVVGATNSANFPTSASAFQTKPGGLTDAFVSRLNPEGSALLFSTRLGGSNDDQASALALDVAGNVAVTGSTASANFPVTAGVYQPLYGGQTDAFVIWLNGKGESLLASTFLGGAGMDEGQGIALDPSGNVYVTGGTQSREFPTTPDAFQNLFGPGTVNSFVLKLDSRLDKLSYSTFGAGGTAIAYLAEGEVYAMGIGTARLNATGSALTGFNELGALGMAVDSGGNLYFGGQSIYGCGSIGGPDICVFSDATIARVDVSTFATTPIKTLFVPIVLSAGGLNNSYYNTELTLCNRSPKNAQLEITYTAAFGGGSGTGSFRLPAGRQRIFPDAIAFLWSIGIPVASSGDRGGTLRIGGVGFQGPEIAATARTTTLAAAGRAGLAYPALSKSELLNETVYLCGLRQNSQDRSNVAIQNAGGPNDGDVVLRVTVISGDPANPVSFALPDERLSPGAFKQFSSILSSIGGSFANGYVRIEKLSGAAPFYAYAVINDQGTSDGSFIPPVKVSDIAEQPPSPGRAVVADSGACLSGDHPCYFSYWYHVPVMVGTDRYQSELMIANLASKAKSLCFDYVADFIETPAQTTHAFIEVQAGEQVLIPDFVQWLVDRGAVGVNSAAGPLAGALFVSVIGGETGGLVLGARTLTTGPGGRYGVFYPDQPNNLPLQEKWLYGLQQNAETRTNLALVNTGEWDCKGSDRIEIDIYDGATGAKVRTVSDINLGPHQWVQINSFLALYAPQVSQGYVFVSQAAGSNPFLVYAVINDGGKPGERTGDGAFIASSP